MYSDLVYVAIGLCTRVKPGNEASSGVAPYCNYWGQAEHTVATTPPPSSVQAQATRHYCMPVLYSQRAVQYVSMHMPSGWPPAGRVLARPLSDIDGFSLSAI